MSLLPVDLQDELHLLILRRRPRCVILDCRGERAWIDETLDLCRRLKSDSYTSTVPLVCLSSSDDIPQLLEGGADEALSSQLCDTELSARLRGLLRRNERDAGVHPSTLLPGAPEINREIQRRLNDGRKFAACYADLDHFKEFNDRYGYHKGDRVIRLLSRILHDVAKGLSKEDGFVGHIGGDDFLFVVPLQDLSCVCDEVISTFEELIELQYTETDRRVGFFFGKDRRGQLHRVPLMTLSIGVVTNEKRRFTRAEEVSELATEMKGYAKTLDGSIWTVDRRGEDHTTVERGEL